MFFSEHATDSDDQASRRDGAALLTQPTSYHLHWPGLAGTAVASCGSCPNRLVAHVSVSRTKKYANMTGQSTSMLMSRPRLKVRPAPSMNNTRRRSDFLCSHQRISRPVQRAISMPAATGPKYLAKVQDAAADHSGGNGGVHTELAVLAVRGLEAAPLRVVNSNQRL